MNSNVYAEMFRSEFGVNPHIISFNDTTCSVRRTDGTELCIGVSSSPALLYAYAEKGEWGQAIQLCRIVKDDALWGCLAAMAINGRELNAAEVAYAAIREVCEQ